MAGTTKKNNQFLIRALWFLIAMLLLAGSPLVLRAGDDDGDGEAKETLEVKQADHKGRKHESLRFLRDNRDFIRAQLDRLRLEVRRDTNGDALELDERFLMLQELSEEIAAASDTLQLQHDFTAQRDLLASVAELGDLESELDFMDSLLTDHRGRLLTLEEDFLGHQATALVIVVRGLPEKNPPTALLLREEEDFLRIDLSVDQLVSMHHGGVAQIYHEFVEPREHVMNLQLEGEGWESAPQAEIRLDTPRDRLTFLELDLSQINRDQLASGVVANVWQR